MKKRLVLIAGVSLVTFALFLAAWMVTYPDKYDRRNLHYVLWKHGIMSMNLDDAVETMVVDPDRDRMVIGMTEAQLSARYGYLLTVSQSSAYRQGEYWYSGYKGRKGYYLRKSMIFVVFDGDKAVDTVLMKG
jgi:hypothetical protein